MSTSFAQGTLTSKRIASPAAAAAPTPQEVPTEAEFLAMATPARVERVLIPQHEALRTSVALLRAAANQLAHLHATGAPVLRRVVILVDDLALLLRSQFDHEERVLFPSMIAGRAAANAAGTLHDHHEAIATRLRWLRLLAAEVRAVAGINRDTMILYAGIATVTRLFHRHRQLERWVALTPDARPSVSSASSASSVASAARRG